MNFYKHHIGDYAQATAHLSFVEDAAYSRLIRKYYADERPLPPDPKAVQRLVGARTRDEKEAVGSVLNEFFQLQEDGWHNKRCDAELAKANAQADTNRRIAEEREARRRARTEHESLHGALNESSTNRPPATNGEREPSQTPDSRLQTPDKGEGESVLAQPPDKPAPKPRGSRRVPEDFEVTDEMRAWAATNTPLADCQRETEKFRDCEFPKPHSDWLAVWRNWLRRAQEDAERKGKQLNGKHDGDDPFELRSAL